MTHTTLSQGARFQLVARGIVAPLVMVVLLFAIAGRWDYWQGWFYIGLSALSLVLMATVFTPDSALIEERLRPGEGTKGWDKLYFALSTPMYLLALVIAGLDARFGWTGELPMAAYLAGVAAYVAGQAVFLWARYANRYFSSVVRIQADRGQTVCQDGPYRYVRHPGYVGGILFTASMGLVLGSTWAVLPQLAACLLLVWRTAREDRTLLAELPGYAGYARQTRYRLIPGIW
jgi:protein-S-isoprenylcysteine O-methyltransferase Ste14